MSMLQGALQADAPLLLEIFTALFDHVDAEVLRMHQPKAAAAQKTAPKVVHQPMTAPHQRPRLAHTCALMQRHPRFGGVFTKKADGGRAQCSIGRPTSQDPLGPVAPVIRASKTVHCLAMPSLCLLSYCLPPTHVTSTVLTPVGHDAGRQAFTPFGQLCIASTEGICRAVSQQQLQPAHGRPAQRSRTRLEHQQTL